LPFPLDVVGVEGRLERFCTTCCSCGKSSAIIINDGLLQNVSKLFVTLSMLSDLPKSSALFEWLGVSLKTRPQVIYLIVKEI
jgi:hypothetical protein